MPETRPVPVADLSLDLRNYRTVRQPNEISAVKAMISTSPDRFWALTESLLQDGYLPTESIIVLRAPKRPALIVKEGNRRIAVLKILHGLLPAQTFDLPDNVRAEVDGLTRKWREENREVPCTIYGPAEAATVDRIVTLTHGKGERAGRDHWNTVARARHNRDVSKASESALDLLEKYLKQGQSVTVQQRARWAGVYPLSVLAEAIKRLAPRFGAANSSSLSKAYPDIKNRSSLESILRDIGLERLGFDAIRSHAVDFADVYGVPPLAADRKSADTKSGSPKPAGSQAAGATASGTNRKSQPVVGGSTSVKRMLSDFQPVGKRREKVIALRDEAVQLNLLKTPLAFCFVLRSMFEISAKAYCSDHASSGLSAIKADGQDKPLVDVLREVTNHLTKNRSDKSMVKALHGALTELAKSNGLLSVTSMNQLVHNPQFSIAPGDITALFGNIFPLLEEMSL